MAESFTLTTSSGVPRATILAAPFASFRSQIDDPIGHFDDVEVMLDDDYGVPQFHQAVEDVEELLHVVKVQAGGGFIQDVQRPAGSAAAELARKFHPSGLPRRRAWWPTGPA